MRQWHIVGDSHVGAMHVAYEGGHLERACRFTMVAGATAVGLRNPNSQTDALRIFREALLPAQADATPVVQLGEVDCGFVIWYRAQKYGESVDVQIEQSLQAYFEFVDALIAGGYPTVVVTGATLPTILDGQDWGEIASARRTVTASLKQRTALTLQYNAALRAMARRRGLGFIDISDVVLDRGAGVVSDAFRHSSPTDHHLHPERAGMAWAEALNRVGRSARIRRAEAGGRRTGLREVLRALVRRREVLREQG